MRDNYQDKLKQLIDSYETWFKDEKKFKAASYGSNLAPYTELFKPLMVNRTKFKNRLIMAPMMNAYMCDDTGTPSAKMAAYFKERARGGVGMICTGPTPAKLKLDPGITDVNDMSLLARIDGYRSCYGGWKSVIDGCQAHGAKVFVQLTAGAGRQGSPECVTKRFRLPISASINHNYYLAECPCRPITDLECHRMIKAFGQTSADIKGLGADGVYLHGHEGYLITQMTNPAFNRRLFGRYANWQTFGLDMVREMRRRVGPDFPIMYRLDFSLALNETYGAKMDTERLLRKFKNERTIAQTLTFMANLVAAGVDIFDVDLGCYETFWLPHPPNMMPPGMYVFCAEVAKAYFEEHGIKSNAGVAVPMVAVGKLGLPDLAESILREQRADAIMLGRPLLADPQWPNKVYAGRVGEIVPCIGDQEGCLGSISNGTHIQCAVNPRCGREDTLPETAPAAVKPKSIAVVGAGPAGLMCAVTAAERGHKVTVFEAAQAPGGNLRPGSRPRIKYEVGAYLAHLERWAARKITECDLRIHYNTKVDTAFLAAGKFDAVVTATGSQPLRPHLPGMDQAHVVNAIDLLMHPQLAAPAQRIVIVGGADVGCEVAYMLRHEHAKTDITIIEMLPHLMLKTVTPNRTGLIHHLERGGVKVFNCTRLVRINPDSVEVRRNHHRNVPNPYDTLRPILPPIGLPELPYPIMKKIGREERIETVPADLVVLAVGARPYEQLYEECVGKRVAAEIHNLGDSDRVGRVLEATRAGYALGVSI